MYHLRIDNPLCVSSAFPSDSEDFPLLKFAVRSRHSQEPELQFTNTYLRTEDDFKRRRPAARTVHGLRQAGRRRHGRAVSSAHVGRSCGCRCRVALCRTTYLGRGFVHKEAVQGHGAQNPPIPEVRTHNSHVHGRSEMYMHVCTHSMRALALYQQAHATRSVEAGIALPARLGSAGSARGHRWQPQEVQVPMPAFLLKLTKTGSPPPARSTRWLIRQIKEREVYGREKAGPSGMQLMREVIYS